MRTLPRLLWLTGLGLLSCAALLLELAVNRHYSYSPDKRN